MRRIALRLTLFVVGLALLTGCATPVVESGLDARLRDLIETAGLTGDPARGRDLPEISDPVPQLGMQLFFTMALRNRTPPV